MLQKAYLPQLRLENLWTICAKEILCLCFASLCFSLNAQVIIEVDDINLFNPSLPLENIILENQLELPVEFAPNPVVDYLNIRSNIGIIEQLLITTYDGELVIEISFPSGQIPLNLDTGYYWIRCKVGSSVYPKLIWVV